MDKDLNIFQNAEVDLKVNGGPTNIGAFLGSYDKVILKPNKKGSKNVLEQWMLSAPHTKYVIKYDFTLEDTIIEMPDDAILEIDCGSLQHGILKGNNTVLLNTNDADNALVDIVLQGTWKESLEEQTAKIVDKITKHKLYLTGNTLTQDMINIPDTIYVIKDNLNLETDITIPANCILEFDGGSISGEHTITGNNTAINAAPIGVFGNNVEIAGTWNVEYVLLDWFMPDDNGYYDNSFKNALKVCQTLHCTTYKIYNFSGEIVDCRDMYGRIHIVGNNCILKKFFFAYDIKTDGMSHVTSGIAEFHNIIEGIQFHGDYANNKPCIFTAAYLEVRNCTVLNYENFLGYTPVYVDYLKLCNIMSWNDNHVRMNLISFYNYDYTEGTGFVGDWIYIESVHAEAYIKIGTNDKLNIHMVNSLHILFEFADNSSIYQYSKVTCYAVSCHWENNTPIIINNNEYLNLDTKFVFERCYFYSTALPQDSRVLNGVILKDSRIVYWNNNNYAPLPNLHKALTTHYNIDDGSGILSYIDTKFIDYNLNPNRIIEGTITPFNSNQYYSFAVQNEGIDEPNYLEAQSVQYLVAYSTREDCLYNGGNTPTVYWSNTISIPSGKYLALTLYINENMYSFVHIYRKDMNSNTIKYVVLRASSIKAVTGYNSVRINDTRHGVYGYPWQEYTGQESDIKYVASV